jgi:hypothetical protein
MSANLNSNPDPSVVNLSPIELDILRHLAHQNIPPWMYRYFTPTAKAAVEWLTNLGLADYLSFNNQTVIGITEAGRAALAEPRHE